MIRGEQFELEITDMGTDGQGVGKKDGMAVFVAREGNGPIFGDTVLAETVEIKKRFAKARLIETVRPSVFRCAPFCRCSEECGGCMLQNMAYEGQLALKEKQARDKYARIAGIDSPDVKGIAGMDSPYRFRNKSKMAIGNGNVGFFSARSHKVVDCATCKISAKPAEAVAAAVREFIGMRGAVVGGRLIEPGILRNVTVRTAFGTGEVMAVVAVNGNELPRCELLIQMMDEAVHAIGEGRYSLESVALQTGFGNVPEKCEIIAGRRTIADVVGGMKFEMSPQSFYQVNPAQAVRLYGKVSDYAGLAGGETVLDAYCGVGTIGLWCASRAGMVLGIESNKGAVLDANRNAVVNGIVNAQYICGQAEKELPKLAEKGFSADVAILDPPRAGCERELLESVSRVGAKRIVYVSCDIATQARDIKTLKEFGYEFVEASLIDMFPWSLNTESVALLSAADVALK
ncbi:MAG: 23S rRNA (uracil(1939)-C(5))-methyltransferase RlmD [Clostridiales bacterium]|nr:23S rRNA (uracil(1939)-C(5))-methyltransferase RlmD [Clostridiales bacterium]